MNEYLPNQPTNPSAVNSQTTTPILQNNGSQKDEEMRKRGQHLKSKLNLYLPYIKISISKIIILVLIILALLITVLIIRSIVINSRIPTTSKETTQSQSKYSFAPVPKLAESFDQTLQDLPITCPLNKSLCQDKNNFKNGLLVAKSSSASAILAAFSGDYETLISYHPDGDKMEEFTTVILNNPERGMLGYYNFIGNAPKGPGTVKEGERIGISSGKLVPGYDATITFQLVRLGSEISLSNDLNPALFIQ